MDTPFTIEQFFEVFRNYNLAVWPIQIVFYVMALLAVYGSFKKFTRSNKVITLILALLWLWIGIVYHFIFFTGINKAAYGFGLLFIIQGGLFITLGIIKKELLYRFKPDVYGITGLVLVIYALILYPLLGYFFGHIYPESPTFGLPCPTTIFTFGLLLFVVNKLPFYLLIIPLIWSLIGFSASMSFGVVEDTGLLLSAVITSVLVIVKNRRLKFNDATT